MAVVGLLAAIALSDTTHRLYEYRRGGSVGPYPLNALEVAALVTFVLMAVIGPFMTLPWLKKNASEGWVSIFIILILLYFFPILAFALYFFIRLLVR